MQTTVRDAATLTCRVVLVSQNRYVTPSDFLVCANEATNTNSFDFEMPSNMDLQASSCSSCAVLENKSNYWTPTLYYQSPTNGSFYRVRFFLPADLPN